MTTAEQIELREQAKADAFIETQIQGCDPLDLLRYDQRPFELFFEIAYWRRRTVELMLEREQAGSACKMPTPQEQDEWRNG